jgi:hypothetical protein
MEVRVPSHRVSIGARYSDSQLTTITQRNLLTLGSGHGFPHPRLTSYREIPDAKAGGRCHVSKAT